MRKQAMLLAPAAALTLLFTAALVNAEGFFRRLNGTTVNDIYANEYQIEENRIENKLISPPSRLRNYHQGAFGGGYGPCVRRRGPAEIYQTGPSRSGAHVLFGGELR